MDVPSIWQLADTFNGLMVILNLIALLGLAKLVQKELKDYDENFLLERYAEERLVIYNYVYILLKNTLNF